MTIEVLGVQCVACGAKRRHKSLRYHPETFQAYCENPYVCTEEHPNSPINLIKRQRQQQLMTFDEAEPAYRAGVVVEKVDRIKRLMSNPLTVRITSVDMAEFLVRQSEATEQNISELVRGFIQTTMEKFDTRTDTTDVPKPAPAPIQKQVSSDDLIF